MAIRGLKLVSGILQKIAEFVTGILHVKRLQPYILKVKLMHNTFAVFEKHFYLTRFGYLVRIL